MNEPQAPAMSPLFPETIAAKGAWRFVPLILLIVSLTGAIFHAATLPTGATGYQNAPDEAAHVVYIRSLARGVMPTQANSAADPLGYEWHQPPLYYAIGTLFLPLGERGLRGLSILCGVLTLLVIYRTARLLKPDDPDFAILAMGVAALLPTHLVVTSGVNNDSLLELCCSSVLYLLLVAFRSGLNLWRAVWLGVLIGLAVLTKVSGILLLPTAIFACLLMRLHGETGKSVWRGVGGILAGFLVVSSWWFVRNQLVYGSPLPLSQFNAAFAGTMQAETAAQKLGGWNNYWQHCAESIFQSFWAVYTTTQGAIQGIPRFLEPQVYLLFVIVAVGVIGGMTRLHFQRKTEFTPMQQHFLWVLFAFLTLIGGAFAAFLTKYYQVQGRYLFPAMLPLSFVVALGWRAILPKDYKGLGSAFLLILLGATSLILLRYIAYA